MSTSVKRKMHPKREERRQRIEREAPTEMLTIKQGQAAGPQLACKFAGFDCLLVACSFADLLAWPCLSGLCIKIETLLFNFLDIRTFNRPNTVVTEYPFQHHIAWLRLLRV